jgi:hypothetical protein
MKSYSKGRLYRKTGYSFLDFLGMLESVDISKTNLHFRTQLNEIEAHRSSDLVINISRQDLASELINIAEAWSLPIVDLRRLEWLTNHETKRKAKTANTSHAELDDVVLDYRAASGKRAFPEYDQLLTPRTRARIEQIYAADFKAYSQFL